jgi:hypothetical protein
LPLFDFPYQIDAMNAAGGGFFGSYTGLSMDQSLALTMDVYSAMHFGMKKLYDSLTIEPMWKNAVYYGGTLAGIFVFAYYIPLGYPWMHTEFNRAVLRRSGFNSLNVWYGSDGWGITDDDLEQFKLEKPFDTIRMNEAGVEGYVLFSDRMLRNIFFYDLNNLSVLSALFSTLFGAKTRGWVAGDEYLSGNVSVNLGVSARF